MKSRLISNTLALILCIGASQFAIAEDAAAVKTLAGMVAGMTHFPSEAQKAELMRIQEDASNSQAVRIIAQAVHDMQHQLSAEDKARLSEILASDASAEVKTLAEVLVGFLHSASAEARARLNAI